MADVAVKNLDILYWGFTCKHISLTALINNMKILHRKLNSVCATCGHWQRNDWLLSVGVQMPSCRQTLRPHAVPSQSSILRPDTASKTKQKHDEFIILS